MDNCIFCKIAAGIIPTEKVYEDDKVLAFLDKNPKVPGHTLLIPKEHSTWFEEMSDDTSDYVFRVAKQLARDMKKDPDISYVQLSIVGKDVPHTHVHLLPHHGLEKAATL